MRMLDPETRTDLAADLRRDEGRVLKPYRDSVGVWTVGYGHNLESGPVLSQAAVDQILSDDIDAACAFLDFHLPWWMNLSPIRQRVLANMAFNLGASLLEFHTFLGDAKAGDHTGAAAAMLQSRWATQVGARADRLAELWRTNAPLGT